jgi:hypothetical protein
LPLSETWTGLASVEDPNGSASVCAGEE